MIRRATLADTKWILDTAVKAYGDQMREVEATRNWIVARIKDEDTAILRGDKAVVIVNVHRKFYDPSIVRAKVIFFFTSEPTIELLAAFKAAARWAKSRGATRLQFDRSNGGSIGPLARRLGAVIDYHSYYLELGP